MGNIKSNGLKPTKNPRHPVITDPNIYADVMEAVKNDQPDLLILYLSTDATSGDAGHRMVIYEQMVTDTEYKGNLLHMVTMGQARNCATLLVNPPYNWSPDVPNALGWTPLQIAEQQDDIPTLCALALNSKELRGSTPLKERTNEHPLLSTCLIWPQQDSSHHVPLFDFLMPRFGRETLNRLHPSVFHDALDRFGRRAQLMFELLLSDPDLLSEEFTGDEKPFTLWPLKLPPSDMDLSGDWSSSGTYSERAEFSWLSSVIDGAKNLEALIRLKNAWSYHRFRTVKQSVSSQEYGWGPPTLKDFCRIEFRRQMVKSLRGKRKKTGVKKQKSYARLIKELGVPPSLLKYLLYSELWPTTTRWCSFGSSRSGVR
ncbi:unnamed protein product [Calicophoron daubneyi]|uniref:Uncharacterized protein n=1 Tax=Calicophoron daubneyi TaxID=300641 RepID=A0AAV2TTZ5_CALDB